MNILIVNQPINNRGDEAAHRSFMRAMNKYFPEGKIIVFFAGRSENSILQMKVKSPNNEYINVPEYKGTMRFLIKAVKWNCVNLLCRFYPGLRQLRKSMNSADYVICAPGGICMGGFQNWRHITNLLLAKSLQKKVIYYSRSIGPFPLKTPTNKLFFRKSMELLQSFHFISLRDHQSMKLADELNVQYIPSIDTAFLDVPDAVLPEELKNKIGCTPYIVFVPNSLIWHPAYNKASKKEIDTFYIKIIELLNSLFPTYNIVMLPQLFNCGEQSDFNYFKQLKSKTNNLNILVLDEVFSSDIQQKIISSAHAVIGARYHSIVFAINNNVPFISLSYEHKMTGLLELLNKENRSVLIKDLGKSEFDMDAALTKIAFLLNDLKKDEIAQRTANKIAISCFSNFVKKLKS